ncbi:MAG: UPF0280 family protein [Planctomycetota bacterium]|jgi:ApbE superfamily uncharacterized protein (UPF0280 family)
MGHERTYRTFTHREAVFRICCDRFDVVTAEIIRQRLILGEYIDRNPDFRDSFEPLELRGDTPEVAQRMARAGRLVGVGPMAAVAGAMAQCAAEAALEAGASEVIVDNGGDIYLRVAELALIGLGTGTAELADRLGFSLGADNTPVAICSSSGQMGHSTSLGKCDLATVVAKDAALADAAATQAANLVTKIEDVDSTLERIAGIEGVDGVLIAKDDHVGLAGQLPTLVKLW